MSDKNLRLLKVGAYGVASAISGVLAVVIGAGIVKGIVTGFSSGLSLPGLGLAVGLASAVTVTAFTCAAMALDYLNEAKTI